MPRLSKLLEKLEDTAEARWGVWFQRHKRKLPLYIPGSIARSRCFMKMLIKEQRLPA